jgi:peptidoglycan LD-endopeptidase CwlK
MFKFSKKSLSVLSTVNEPLQTLCKLSISRSPVDFGIPVSGGKRTAEQQNELFKQGVSKLDGYKKLSNHQTGNAIDIFAWTNGKVSYEEHYYFLIAGIFYACASELGLKIRWGGEFGSKEFKGWDKPHFEIR